jgi:hypothetical protein
MKNKNVYKIQAADMKLLRSVKECTTLDGIKNKDVRIELNVCSLSGSIDHRRK